jgi:hypothetical protein
MNPSAATRAAAVALGVAGLALACSSSDAHPDGVGTIRMNLTLPDG